MTTSLQMDSSRKYRFQHSLLRFFVVFILTIIFDVRQTGGVTVDICSSGTTPLRGRTVNISSPGYPSSSDISSDITCSCSLRTIAPANYETIQVTPKDISYNACNSRGRSCSRDCWATLGVQFLGANVDKKFCLPESTKNFTQSTSAYSVYTTTITYSASKLNYWSQTGKFLITLSANRATQMEMVCGTSSTSTGTTSDSTSVPPTTVASTSRSTSTQSTSTKSRSTRSRSTKSRSTAGTTTVTTTRSTPTTSTTASSTVVTSTITTSKGTTSRSTPSSSTTRSTTTKSTPTTTITTKSTPTTTITTKSTPTTTVTTKPTTIVTTKSTPTTSSTTKSTPTTRTTTKSTPTVRVTTPSPTTSATTKSTPTTTITTKSTPTTRATTQSTPLPTSATTKSTPTTRATTKSTPTTSATTKSTPTTKATPVTSATSSSTIRSTPGITIITTDNEPTTSEATTIRSTTIKIMPTTIKSTILSTIISSSTTIDTTPTVSSSSDTRTRSDNNDKSTTTTFVKNSGTTVADPPTDTSSIPNALPSTVAYSAEGSSNTIETAVAKPRTADMSWLYIVGGCLALIVILVIATGIFLCRMKKSKKTRTVEHGHSREGIPLPVLTMTYVTHVDHLNNGDKMKLVDSPVLGATGIGYRSAPSAPLPALPDDACISKEPEFAYGSNIYDQPYSYRRQSSGYTAMDRSSQNKYNKSSLDNLSPNIYADIEQIRSLRDSAHRLNGTSSPTLTDGVYYNTNSPSDHHYQSPRRSEINAYETCYSPEIKGASSFTFVPSKTNEYDSYALEHPATVEHTASGDQKCTIQDDSSYYNAVDAAKAAERRPFGNDVVVYENHLYTGTS